jgi:hypothetical protein
LWSRLARLVLTIEQRAYLDYGYPDIPEDLL